MSGPPGGMGGSGKGPGGHRQGAYARSGSAGGRSFNIDIQKESTPKKVFIFFQVFAI